MALVRCVGMAEGKMTGGKFPNLQPSRLLWISAKILAPPFARSLCWGRVTWPRLVRGGRARPCARILRALPLRAPRFSLPAARFQDFSPGVRAPLARRCHLRVGPHVSQTAKPPQGRFHVFSGAAASRQIWLHQSHRNRSVGLLSVPQKRDDFAGQARLLLQRHISQDRLPIWKRYCRPFIAGKGLAHGSTRSEFFAGSTATRISALDASLHSGSTISTAPCLRLTCSRCRH